VERSSACGIPVQNFANSLCDREIRRVQYHCIWGLNERRDRAIGIALIALCDVPQKVVKISMHAFFAQLLIASFRPFLDACREEDFQIRIGENDRAHIAPFRDEARRFAKRPLPFKDSVSHRGISRHDRRGTAHDFVANRKRNVFALKQNRGASKLKVERRGERRDARFVVQRDSFTIRCERDQAIQRTAVEIVKSQLLRNQFRNRALPRA
jgi:hypothetical protein